MFQQLDEWRLQMGTKFEEIENNAIKNDNIRGHVEVLIKDNRISASKIKSLESDFVNLKLEMTKNMTRASTSDDVLPDNISSIHHVLQNQQEQIK